jgi:hypothetical protein
MHLHSLQQLPRVQTCRFDNGCNALIRDIKRKSGMRGRINLRPWLAVGIVTCCPLAMATEGGMGRPITGQQIFSNAGVIPPEPGWIMSVTSIYYEGTLKGGRGVPLIGAVSTGLDVKAEYTIGNFTHVWDTGKGRWNFASGFGVPLQYTDISANLTGPRGRTVGQNDTGTQFADLLLTPIAAGYHFSATDHISFSLPIYVPTGAYNQDRLANPGQNDYTFMPTVAYTHLDGSGGEFSLMSSVEYYTKNHDTDYHSGPVFTLDGLWTHGLGSGWNAGVVAGFVDQIADDKGPTADALGGFRGRSFGAGPTVGWSGKFADTQASVSARWVPEFDTKNRPEGNGFSLNLTLLFL